MNGPTAAPSGAASQFVRTALQGAIPAMRLLFKPDTVAQLPRLFGEGFAPVRRMFVQAHNNYYLARMLDQPETITFVTSANRSGNTWMRYLICDVLLQNTGVQTTTELPVDHLDIIPSYYEKLLARTKTSVPAPGRLIMTHFTIPLVQQLVGGDARVRKWRYLYLYRTPEDTLVSYFYLHLREKYIRSKCGGNIDFFCLEMLPGWVEHVTSFLDALDGGVDIHLACYGEMLRDPNGVLRETLRWLGIPFTDGMVARANANMQFSNLKAMEARNKGRNETDRSHHSSPRAGAEKVPFFRQGREGGGAAELKPETLSKIRSVAGPVFTRANELLARQKLKCQSEGGAGAGSEPQGRPHNSVE
jgi:hypothetical protein